MVLETTNIFNNYKNEINKVFNHYMGPNACISVEYNRLLYNFREIKHKQKKEFRYIILINYIKVYDVVNHIMKFLYKKGIKNISY